MDQAFLKTLLKEDYDSVISIIKQDKRNKKFYVPIYLNEKLERTEFVVGPHEFIYSCRLNDVKK